MMVLMTRSLAILVFGFCFGSAGASSFLSRAHRGDMVQKGGAAQLGPELRSAILGEVEEMLGSDHRRATEGRLARIEDMVRATFAAMPKNEHGKLRHDAVRYTLHSYFVQRHAWYVRGLANMGEGWNSSSPANILQDHVEEFVQDMFERRLGSQGLDLHEMAVLAATLENLVHRETSQRLNASFEVLSIQASRDMAAAEVDQVLDTYMMAYILGTNYSTVRPSQFQQMQNSMYQVYPTWGETKKFLREVRQRNGFHKSFFSRSDVEAIVEEVGDQYGRWQDKECRDLKRQLVAIEDRSTGINGSGRVRIADFYGSALNHGNWQFSESIEYLTKLGALDVSDVGNPRVVIPNYIHSPSNCLASSKFYSVCCINECEDLLDRLEHRFAAPDALPAEIAEFVTSLPSSSVAAGRTLSGSLLARLEEVARSHGGRVPLHGRLFAQWMHHAYPRECPYPHVSGTTKPQSAEDFQSESEREHTASKEEMRRIVQALERRPQEHLRAQQGGGSAETECTVWSHDEELYVGGHVANASTATTGTSAPEVRAEGTYSYFRRLAYLAAAVSGALVVVRSLAATSSAMASSLSHSPHIGKEHFV